MDEQQKEAFIKKLKRDREEAFFRNQSKKREKAKFKSKMFKQSRKLKENPEETIKENKLNISTKTSSSRNWRIKLKTADSTKSDYFHEQDKKISKAQNKEKITPNENNLALPDPPKQKKCFKSKKQKSSSKERMRKLRQNLNEEKKRIIREKDRKRKKEARNEGKVLKIGQMANKQQNQEREKWRDRQRKSRLNRKKLQQVIENTPPSSDIENEFEERVPINDRNDAILEGDLQLPSTALQHIHLKKQGQKRSKKKMKSLQKKLREMEEKLVKQQNEMKKIKMEKEKYKKRWQRISELKQTNKETSEENAQMTLPNPEFVNINQDDISPSKIVENLLQGRECPKHVKKELLFATALTKQIENNLSQNQSDKIAAQKILSGNLLKKYKLHKKIKHFISYKNNKKYASDKDVAIKQKKPYKITTNDMEKIKTFFHLDNISRQCPGKKDVITRRKIKKQKRLLLHNLKTCYTLFKKMHPKVVISFSSFYKLKPFWVVQPKPRDRETCACVKHENFNFIMQKCFLEKIIDTRESKKIINGNFEIILNEECKNDSCKVNQWKTKTEERIIKNERKIIRVTTKTYEQMKKSELLELFQKELPMFKDHVNLVKHQMNYLHSIKENLEPTQLFLQIDFSENYVAKLNNEIQSMHFGANKKQISIHTGVAYYKNMENKINWSFATVSDNLDHQAHAVWSHMKPVIISLTKQVDPKIINQIFIFSDGPTAQYRNRYNLYLAAQHLFQLFPNSKVSWNFSAPGHGKGPMDGIGGTVKRLADRKVLQGTDITCAKEFVDVVGILTKINLFYIDSKEIQLSKLAIPPNVPKIGKIAATYQVNWITQNGVIGMNMRSFSCGVCLFENECAHFSNGKIEIDLGITEIINISKKIKLPNEIPCDTETHIDVPAIGSWVATIYDEHWYPGMITSVEGNYITVKFLTRKMKNYVWPTKEDVQKIKFQEILCILPNPPTSVSKSRPDLFVIPDEDYVNSLYEQIL